MLQAALAGPACAIRALISGKKRMRKDSIESRLGILRKIYLSFSILGFFGIIYLLSGFSHTYGLNALPKLSLFLIWNLIIYSGLKRKKVWVSPLIKFYAVMTVLTLVVVRNNHYQNRGSLIGNWLINFFMALFYFYQLYFFSKKAVEEYMHDKGITLY
ncbi:MAG: hypothetical protein M0Z52_09195 [Actinomycetota bacterium]|nr:hypothetical protein [Actinomycetota bacterium]